MPPTQVRSLGDSIANADNYSQLVFLDLENAKKNLNGLIEDLKKGDRYFEDRINEDNAYEVYAAALATAREMLSKLEDLEQDSVNISNHILDLFNLNEDYEAEWN